MPVKPEKAPENMTGWMPVRALLDNVQTPIIECLNVADIPFTAPFFNQTIRQFREEHPSAQSYRTTLDHLMEGLDEGSDLRPNGLIFHLSRCGSTLVAQMLAALETNRVLSEPGPINDVLGEKWMFAPQSLRKQTLAGLIRILGYPLHPTQQNYFLKFSSWNTVFLPTILSVIPDCRKTFIYRSPIEIMVSTLDQPPQWVSSFKDNPVKSGWFIDCSPRKIALLSKEEFCARLLARIIHVVLEDPTQWMLVNYTELPQAVTTRIAPFFGLTLSQEQEARMQAMTRLHAKSYKEQRLFVPDSATKQQSASVEILRAVEQYVSAPYERLEAFRQAQLNPHLVP